MLAMEQGDTGSSSAPVLEHSNTEEVEQEAEHIQTEDAVPSPPLPEPESLEDSEFPCGIPEVGGHFLRAGVLVFQVLLVMRIEVRNPYPLSSSPSIPSPPLPSASLFLISQGEPHLDARERERERERELDANHSLNLFQS